LSAGVRIFSASDDYTGEFMTNPTVPERFTNVDAATVYLRKHAIVGANSVILPGIEIGIGAAVGAMSLVTKEVPDFEIHAGCPARKISERKRDLLALEEKLRECARS
jgi:galactoside O-acetyltransferase